MPWLGVRVPWFVRELASAERSRPSDHGPRRPSHRKKLSLVRLAGTTLVHLCNQGNATPNYADQREPCPCFDTGQTVAILCLWHDPGTSPTAVLRMSDHSHERGNATQASRPAHEFGATRDNTGVAPRPSYDKESNTPSRTGFQLQVEGGTGDQTTRQELGLYRHSSRPQAR